MKSVFAFGASLSAAALLVALVPACSSKSSSTPTTPPVTEAACEDAKCGENNKCLPGDGETKCRRPCAANTECPSGATCVTATTTAVIPATCQKAPADATNFCTALAAGGGMKLAPYTCPEDAVPSGGCVAGAEAGQWCCNDLPAETYAQAFCVRNLRDLKVGPNQWGAACKANEGLDANRGCDSAQGFFCYGTGPGDGDSYCTRYDCHSDRECAPTFYCATINVAPNVTTTKPTVGKTTTACLRRDYCAPCSADIDCPLLANRKQHCTLDPNGAGFCAPECTTAENCNYDAKCVDAGAGVKTCYPRATTCVGDGTLCAPCRSDADCGADGACVRGQYTQERSCAKKSAIPCKDGAVAGTDFKCPTSANPKAPIRCLGSAFENVPLNYCHGLWAFGESADVGCWTPKR